MTGRRLARRVLPLLALVSLGGGRASLSPAELVRAEQVQQSLRCPICTGESIAESTNDISRAMRAEVERLVAEGRSEREIFEHFEARYGPFVLLDPPKEGANLVLWAGPLLALGLGGWWLWGILNRRQAKAETVTLSGDLEDPYLAQVQSDLAARQSGHTVTTRQKDQT